VVEQNGEFLFYQNVSMHFDTNGFGGYTISFTILASTGA
jgi:hypothetical protein